MVCACVFEDLCTFLQDHNQLYIPALKKHPAKQVNAKQCMLGHN